MRYSGILLHPTSLPGLHGIGDMGKASKDFIDMLHKLHVTHWQVLPLGPTGYGDSPYAARSAFAGNELLIDLGQLCEAGYLSLDDEPEFAAHYVDYAHVKAYKFPKLRSAAEQFLAHGTEQELLAFNRFCTKESWWLDDYALFQVLCEAFGDSRWFSMWDDDISKHETQAIKKWQTSHDKEIQLWKVLQYFFFTQWDEVKAYAHRKGVSIIGDLPIFVAADSADAWSHRELFKIDAQGNQTAQSGVPPDAFSADGQLWGNPVYNWPVHEADGFSWWIERMRMALRMNDMVRIDHFRGLQAYWEVPIEETTAKRGAWVTAPGEQLLSAMRNALGGLPVIAEDLGVITQEVDELRTSFQLPGMKILQFAFNKNKSGDLDAAHAYLPHNYEYGAVAYTGTHDNNTSRGWFDALDEGHRDMVRRYLQCPDEEVVWQMIRCIMASHAAYAIFPMQDILGLDASARMNTPSTCGAQNWSWRMAANMVHDDLLSRFSSFVQLYGRTGNVA